MSPRVGVTVIMVELVLPDGVALAPGLVVVLELASPLTTLMISHAPELGASGHWYSVAPVE